MRKDRKRSDSDQIWKISRRTFLAGAAAMASPAMAAGHFEIDLRNGGFTLYVDGHPVWEVSDQQLRAALGADCELSVVSIAEVRIRLLIENAQLLDESGYTLELDFQRTMGTQCTIGAILRGPGIAAINFESRTLQIGGDWEVSTSLPIAASTRLLAPLGGQENLGRASQFAIDSRLRLLLIAARSFRLAEDLSASRLMLMSGAKSPNGETRKARFLDIRGDSVLPLGRHRDPTARDQISARIDWPLPWTSAHIDVLADGQPSLTIEGPGKLVLSRDANPQERIVVQGDERTRLRQMVGSARQYDLQLLLPKRDVAVATPSGTLVVHGLDELVAPVRLAAKGGIISTFEASLPVSNVGLRLEGADLGRLDFDSARCTIRFGSLGNSTNSDGFVRLGPGRGPSMSFALEKAKLWCARQNDLLFLACRFRDVVLAVTGSEAKLHPREPTSTGDKPDPILIVELPSQHILEQAFFRPLFTPPPWPGEIPTVSQLQNVEERKKLREAAEGRSGRFKQFSEEYRKQWKNKREEIEGRKIDKNEPDNSPDSEWLGSPYLMSVRGRIVERVAAETLNTAFDKRIRDIPLRLSLDQLRDIKARYPKPSILPQQAVQELLANAEKSEPEHALLQQAYRAWRQLQGGSDPRDSPDRISPAWPERIYSREAVEAWAKEALPEGVVKAATASVPEIASWLSELATALPGDPTGGRIREIEAAVSLALRAAVREDISGSLPIEARAAGPTRLAYGLKGKWPKPYSLSTLLQWSAAGSPDFELRVVQRADRVDPNELDSQGIAQILAKRGIPPGASFRARMKAVVDSVRSPMTTQTAIELPARLLLSPDSSSRFQERAEPGMKPSLWRVRLREQENRAFTLRAIDSPDFVSDAFSATPERSRGPKMLEPDDSWIYPGQKFRTSLDPFDRHQLVGLSSLYGLPVIPRSDSRDHSQLTSPKEYALNDLLADDNAQQAVYLPKALPIQNLSLSALGAWMDLDVGFTPPASVRDQDRNNLFDAFNIERWRNQVAWGRDTLVEVLYKGFLCPLGHRATLVKLTERRFLPPGKGHLRPVAYLVQRLFIQVGQPTKSYGAVAQPFEGRGWPAQSITIVTTQTPDLVDPRTGGASPSKDGDFKRTHNGALVRKDEVGLVFWPQTTPDKDGTVQFRMRIDGSGDSVEMPLIFVDSQAAHDPPTMQALQRYYNEALNAKEESRFRRLDHANARRRYAPERKVGDTMFETVSWMIRLDSRMPVVDTRQGRSTENAEFAAMDGALEADDQPPFYPRLDFGVIRHDTVARFTGNAQADLSVTYSERYLKEGFDLYADATGAEGKVEKARKDVVGDTFLRVVGGRPRYNLVRDPKEPSCWPVFDSPPNLTLGSNGDRAGGLARPEQAIPYLARFGPVGGAQGVVGDPRPMAPESFLPSARLLGLVDISELIRFFAMGDASPILSDTLEFLCDGASTIASNLKPLVDRVLAQFHKEERLRSIYLGAYRALQDSSQAISKVEKLKQCSPADAPIVTEMVTSVRTLAHELERLAAPPLAPITAVLRSNLASADDKLSNALGILLAAPKVEFAEAILATLDPLVQPVSLARALLTLSPEQRKLLQEPLLRADLENALSNALKETLGKAKLGTLPPDVAMLRRSIADQILLNLKKVAERSGDPTAKSTILDLAEKMHGLVLVADSLPSLNNLYAMLVALTKSDWIASLATPLKGVVVDVVLRWASGSRELCSDSVVVIRGLLRVALPEKFDASGCPIEKDCKTSPGESICGVLWQVYCALPVSADVARKATEALANSYAVLPSLLERVAAFRDLPDDPECTIPTDAVLQDTQAILSAISEFSKSLISWLHAIATTSELAALKPAAKAAKEALRVLTPRTEELNGIKTQLTHVVGDNVALMIFNTFGQVKTTLVAFEEQLDKAGSDGDRSNLLGVLARQIENDLGRIRGQFLTMLDQASLARLVSVSAVVENGLIRPVVGALINGHNILLNVRRQILPILESADELASASRALGPPHKYACSVFVGPTPADSCSAGTVDEIVRDLDRLKAIQVSAQIAKDFADLLVTWSGTGPAAQRMVRDFKSVLKQALFAQLLGVAQLDDVRAKLESALREIQPFRRKLEYKWNLKLGDFPSSGSVQFRPKGGLTLTARTLISPPKADGSIDLPRSTFEGELAEFAIEVPGYIGLDFKPFSFGSGSDHGVGLDARLKGVRIQAGLAFIALLGAYLGFSGKGGSDKPSGPYIRPRKGGPGVQAGFALSIGAFTIGTLGFANVSFDAGCELPFDGGEAVVSIGLSSREAPFTLIAAPYGGSGFVRLFGGRVGKTIGITSFDAGFEYGGAAAVSYGPLQGVGRVMTGIFVSQLKGETLQIGGLFSASFVGHVACFGIAASFLLMVRPTRQGMMGVAQLSFQFSVGMFKVRFRVTVRRNLGPAIGSVVAAATPLDGAPRIVPVQTGSVSEVLATARTHAVSPLQNWERYKSYYRAGILAKGRRAA